MVDRISTFTQTNNIQQNSIRVQSQLAEGQIQLSSGKISQTFDGVFIDTQRILNIESEIEDLRTKRENAITVQNRLEIQFNAIGDIIGATQGYLADLNAALSGDFASPPEVRSVARNTLDSVETLLNTQLNDRFLFAGSATNTRPVETEPTPLLGPVGAATRVTQGPAAGGPNVVPSSTATVNEQFFNNELDGGDEITVTLDIGGGAFTGAVVVNENTTIDQYTRDLQQALEDDGFEGLVQFNRITGELEYFIPESDAGPSTFDIQYELTTLGDGANIPNQNLTNATANDGTAVVGAGGLTGGVNFTVLGQVSNINYAIPQTTYSDEYYYSGNEFIQSVEVDNGFILEYGVLANDPIFRDMIEAFNLVLNTPATSDDNDYATALTRAYTQLDDAIDRLAELQVIVGQDAQAVDRTIADFDNEENLLVNIISQLTDVDLAQVTLNNTQLQNQLEASFSVTAQILRTSLIDFIR